MQTTISTGELTDAPLLPYSQRMSKLRGRVNRGIAWSGLAQVVIGVAELLSVSITLAFFVSANDWGAAGTALLLYPVLDALADSGLANAVIQRDDHSADKLSTVFWLNVLISCVLFGLTVILSPYYAAHFGQPVLTGLIIAYGAKLVVQNAYQLPLALLRRDMRFDDVAKLRIHAHLAESVTRPLFAAAGLTIWCSTLAALVRIAVISLEAQWLHPFRPRFVFRLRLIREYVRFGLRNAGSQVLYYAYTNVDYLIVRQFFGEAALGIYMNAYKLVLEPVRSISNAVTDVALPAFARIKHQREEVQNQLIAFLRLNVVTVLPLLILLFCGIEDGLITFYQKWTVEQIHTTAVCIQWLCGIGLLRAVGFLGPPLLDGIGRPGLTLAYTVTAAVLLTGAYWGGAVWLGDDLGVVSVAIAWNLAYPIAFVLLGVLMAKAGHIHWGTVLRKNGDALVVCAIALSLGLLVRALLSNQTPWLRLVATVPTVAVALALGFTRIGMTPSALGKALRQ